MVAAQRGETRDPDARTGGGVSGRFRPLGASGAGEAPDTTPPPFGTAPWGYRRSEVDAWASWVAGLVAHGRNETIRADSAEATLQATLERLEQLERRGAAASPLSDPDVVRPLPSRTEEAVGRTPGPDDAAPTAGDADGTGAVSGARDPAADPGAVSPGPASRAPGRLHFDAPADLPRRTARATPVASAGDTADPPGTAASSPGGCDPAPSGAAASTGPSPTGAAPSPGGPDPDTPSGAAASTGPSPAGAAASARSTPADPAPGDHDLARLHVVETTLHEVLELLHRLSDRR